MIVWSLKSTPSSFESLANFCPIVLFFLVLSSCGDFLKWLSGVHSLCSLLLPVMTYRVLLLTGVSGWGYDHVKKTFAWMSGEKGHGRFRSYIGVKCRAWTCEEKENFCMNEWKKGCVRFRSYCGVKSGRLVMNENSRSRKYSWSRWDDQRIWDAWLNSQRMQWTWLGSSFHREGNWGPEK